MAILKDIEVRIARNTSGKVVAKDAGDALPEYQTPDSSGNRSQTSIERYVEAVTGQPFQIEVYINPSFKFYRADGITVGLEIDDKTVYFNKHHTKQEVEERQKTGEPLVISSVRRVEGARYFRTGFAFGSLALDEKIDIDKDLANRQAEQQGRIIVDVERYVAEKLRKPETRDIQDYYKSTASVDFAKDVYKDRHIRHAVMPGLETESKSPNLKTHQHRSYRQYSCKRLDFVFRYRDHLGLQLLGCKSKEPVAELPPTELIGIEEMSNNSDAAKAADAEGEGHDEGHGGDMKGVRELRIDVERLKEFERENANLKRKIKGLEALGRENTDLKQINGGLIQEVASLKAIKDQMACLIGNLGKSNTASTPLPFNPNLRTEIEKRHIKKEQSEGRSSPCPGSKERPAKRPRTFVELD